MIMLAIKGQNMRHTGKEGEHTPHEVEKTRRKVETPGRMKGQVARKYATTGKAAEQTRHETRGKREDSYKKFQEEIEKG